MTITVEGSYAAAKLWYALQCEFGFVRLPLLHLSKLVYCGCKAACQASLKFRRWKHHRVVRSTHIQGPKKWGPVIQNDP